MCNFVLVLSGRSGSGKNYFVDNFLIKNKFELITSTTTRPIRLSDGEIDGVHYNFVDKEAFKLAISNDEFIEYADVHGNLYGTTYKSIFNIYKKGNIPVAIVDPDGHINLCNKLHNKKIKTLSVFLDSDISKSSKSLMKRCLNALKANNKSEYLSSVKRLDKLRAEANWDSSLNYDLILKNSFDHESLNKAVIEILNFKPNYSHKKPSEINSDSGYNEIDKTIKEIKKEINKSKKINYEF